MFILDFLKVPSPQCVFLSWVDVDLRCRSPVDHGRCVLHPMNYMCCHCKFRRSLYPLRRCLVADTSTLLILCATRGALRAEIACSRSCHVILRFSSVDKVCCKFKSKMFLSLSTSLGRVLRRDPDVSGWYAGDRLVVFVFACEVHLYLTSPRTVQLTLLSNPYFVVKRKFTVSVQWIVGNFSYLGPRFSPPTRSPAHLPLPGPCRCQQCVAHVVRSSCTHALPLCLDLSAVFLEHHRT